MKGSKIAKFVVIGFLVSFMLGFGFVSYVQGHSPSGMSLVYHTSTEILDVTITHSVSNLQTHFVESVDIFINDVLNHSEDYTSQPSNTFTYNYNINATIGDTIKATAICNLGGSITSSITVSDGNNGNPTNNASINGACIFLIGLPLLSLVSKYIYKRRK